MYAAPAELPCALFSRLPDEFRNLSEASEWARFERPGQALHSFLEGPSFDREGRLYCVDIAFGRIFRISPSGEWSIAAKYDGEPTGLKINADGRIFIADNKLGVLEMDPVNGAITPFLSRINLEPFRGCNDLVFASNGDLYLTVPGQSSLADPCGRLYRVTPAGEATLLLADIPYPNGLVLDLAEKNLYLAVTYANAIWRVPLPGGSGPAMGVGLHIQMSGGLGPDGLALDQEGNLAVAYARHGSVWLFNEFGEPLYRIRSCAGRSITNLAYGGPGNRQLFITEAASGSILRAEMPVPGRTMYSHS